MCDFFFLPESRFRSYRRFSSHSSLHLEGTRSILHGFRWEGNAVKWAKINRKKKKVRALNNNNNLKKNKKEKQVGQAQRCLPTSSAWDPLRVPTAEPHSLLLRRFGSIFRYFCISPLRPRRRSRHGAGYLQRCFPPPLHGNRRPRALLPPFPRFSPHCGSGRTGPPRRSPLTA